MTLSDSELSLAGSTLGTAARTMEEGSEGRPSAQFPSLTGIGDEADEFLRSIEVAQNALADAAKSASHAVNGLMEDSSALDARLAASLYSGYAVGTGAQ
ncbi:hypothetical protein [Leucobacter chromiiresistens]|uniref:hypothetical protein n=1 Tax=Leucobacter chromiiresistens TaxID=1079994 RepID=UPI00115F7F66|nr:hypothetical protein [Leucobacter chromiiresistens]